MPSGGKVRKIMKNTWEWIGFSNSDSLIHASILTGFDIVNTFSCGKIMVNTKKIRDDLYGH